MTRKVNISTDIGADVHNVNATLSRKLKALRQNHGLTLDELSKLSGVSKGMLVEIEKGEANPSIAILCKTASALGVSVADIVDVAETTSIRIVSKEDAQTLWRGPKGGTATLLVGSSGPEMIELWRWNMTAGETFKSPGHSKGSFELLNVESGVLTIELENKSFEISAGSSAIAKTDGPHSYSNKGKKDLQFVMTVAELHRQRTSI
ncbi:MAG: helix-turn-helix domain-containing protein [Leptolyngbya sp.]|nr:helix-turn-helix domain-containing protein [Candidatus Melainabacteria bacterium]